MITAEGYSKDPNIPPDGIAITYRPESDKNIICGIYVIINPMGKIYIGQSKNCNRRKYSYKKLYCKTQRRIFYSIKKYGWEKHTFEILHECDSSQLNYWENFYIKLFDSFDTKHGLNLVSANVGIRNISIETKEKLRKANIGNTYSLGKKHSNEAKVNHSNAVSGERHPFFGKQLSASHKNKIIVKTKGVAKSIQAKRNISENHFKRPVNQYDMSGHLIKKWESAKEAQKNGFNYSAIHNTCQGKRKSHAGYRWEFYSVLKVA